MVESNQEKNYLRTSNLPSIGCFVTILQYLGASLDIKEFLTILFKSGKTFYKRHVKNSTEFSQKAYINTKRPDIVTINLGL